MQYTHDHTEHTMTHRPTETSEKRKREEVGFKMTLKNFNSGGELYCLRKRIPDS